MQLTKRAVDDGRVSQLISVLCGVLSGTRGRSEGLSLTRRQGALRLGAAVGLLGNVACASLLCVACDGYLGVEGTVSRAQEGASSAIAIDDADPRAGAQPVADCGVSLEPYTAESRPKPETAALWTSHGTTDAAGHFKVGGTARPGHYDATIAFACPGYEALQRVFRHDRLRHRAAVLLRPVR
jgi:hypothetical protein